MTRRNENGPGANRAAGETETTGGHIIPFAPAHAPKLVRRRKPGGYLPIYATWTLGELAQLSLEARGAYVSLFLQYWVRKSPLPDDDRVLALLSGAGRRWPKLRAELARFFSVGGGLWRHDHVDHEIAYLAYVSSIQTAKVRSRWDRERAKKGEA